DRHPRRVEGDHRQFQAIGDDLRDGAAERMPAGNDFSDTDNFVEDSPGELLSLRIIGAVDSDPKGRVGQHVALDGRAAEGDADAVSALISRSLEAVVA